jgi:transcriptional regulator with XRE-family HTH domain
MIDIAARFGDNLAHCRKRADLSQDELNVLASVHRTEVSQLERGLRLPRIDTLVKLSRVARWMISTRSAALGS